MEVEKIVYIEVEKIVEVVKVEYIEVVNIEYIEVDKIVDVDAESVPESVAVLPPCTQFDEDSQTQMEFPLRRYLSLHG